MKPRTMSAVINGKRYNTETAVLVAHNGYWDGRSCERNGRNTFLYRTPRGNYFCQYRTMWQGDRDRLVPVSVEEAIELYTGPLTEHEVPFELAFPGVTVEDA